MTFVNLQNGFKISRTQIILLLASSANAWKDRVQIQESDKEYKLSGSVGSSMGFLSGSQGGSYRSSEVGDNDILMEPSQENFQVDRTFQLKNLDYPVTVIKDEIIQFGVSNILEIFLEKDQYIEVLEHGCWCARLNPEADHSILGGNKMLDMDGDGSADDKGLDILCKEWIMARQCNKLSGGSCNPQTGTVTEDPYTIDFSHPANYTCTDTIDCQLDSCEIDAYYAFEIYNFVLDHGILLYQAESGDCKDPDVLVSPQQRECTGTIPDGLQIVIVDPNQL